MKAQIEALKNHSFRNFFIGSFISFFGSGLNLLASSWYILKATGSSKMVALAWIASLSSGPFLLIYSGAIIDRFDRRNLLIILSAARCLIVAIIPISIWLGTFSLWQIYAVLVLEGIGFNISFPAEKALVQEIMEEKGLVIANSLIEISIQAGVFIAAGAGGFIYKEVGLAGVFVIDSITFIIAAIMLRRIRHRSSESGSLESRKQKYLKSVGDGWKFLFAHKNIFFIGTAAFIPTTIAFVSNAVTPVYVRQILGKGVITYGVIEMSYGIGAFLSGFLAPTIIRHGKLRIMKILFLILAIVLLSTPSNPFTSIALALYFAFGLCNSSLRIILSTILMEVSPKSLMGRISSAAMFNSFFLQILSFAIVSTGVDTVSVGTGYYYLAALAGLVIAVLLFRTSKKAMVIEGNCKVNPQ